jgi:hypothetical protein
MEVHRRLPMIVLVLGLCAIAPADDVPVARFAGRVVDAEGRPVAGARLWLQVVRADGGSGFLARNLGTADDDGRFAAEVPQTPLPRVNANGETVTRPWPKRWRYVVATWEPSHGLGWARADAGARMIVRMTRPAVLRGRLLDADGGPQPDIPMRLESLRIPQGTGDEDDDEDSLYPGLEPQPPWAHTRTDAGGRFEFTGLPVGAVASVSVEPSEEGRYQWPDQWPPDAEKVTLSAHTPELTIRLVREAVIAGRLLLPAGKTPAARIRLRLYGRGLAEADDAHVDYGSTDESGRYRFTRLPAGRYAISIYRDEYEPVVAEGIEVTPGQQRELPAVVLRPRPSAWVEGRVLDADTGAPIAGAGVRVGGPPVSTPLVMTGPDGRYRARTAPVETRIYVDSPGSTHDCLRGAYTVTWVRKGGRLLAQIAKDEGKPSSRELHPKPGELITGVDLYLRRGAEVVGTVIGPDGNPWCAQSGHDPYPPSCERVVATLDPACVADLRRALPGAHVDESGAFWMPGLYPEVPVILTVFDSDLEVGGAVQVTPEADEPTEVVIHLGPAARVRGRVLMPDGKPAAGAHVGVVGVAAIGVYSDAEGRFDLAGGVPGLPCTVIAHTVWRADRKDCLKGLSRTVAVAAGREIVNVGDIVLAPVKLPSPQ